MIATDDRRSIYQNAANCMMIRFCYIAQQGSEGYSSAHVHVIMCNPLPVVQAACRVRRYFQRTFSAVETVLRYGRMFQGSDEV